MFNLPYKPLKESSEFDSEISFATEEGVKDALNIFRVRRSCIISLHKHRKTPCKRTSSYTRVNCKYT